jgi:hypothetical protein
MPTGLLKTGQTTSYLAGDDGDYQKGVSRTFAAGGTTGLIWQRCSAGQNYDASCSGTAQTYTWDQANSYCSNLSLAGVIWRLPNLLEITNIINFRNYIANSNSILNSEFTNSGNEFWSSNISALSSSNYWAVNYYGLYPLSKSNLYNLKCVSGSSQLAITLNSGSQIVTASSGLVWQKCSNGQDSSNCSGTATQYKWADAILQCENLNLANRIDWRLPNINELKSIVDYTKNSSPSININYFPNTLSSPYWSSTTWAGNLSGAWGIDFSNGSITFLFGGANYYTKTYTLAVRCVTGP